MSHKHKHNYSNYSKPQEAPVVESEVKVEEPVVTPEPVADPEPAVAPEVPVADPETPANSDELIGVVTDCVKLNVRAEASKEADIVAEILLGTEVQIDNFESTDEFYKVVTATGVEGFCMKKFIAVNS